MSRLLPALTRRRRLFCQLAPRSSRWIGRVQCPSRRGFATIVPLMSSAAVLIVLTIAGLTTNSTSARVSHLAAAASDSVIATGPGYYAALHECGRRGATNCTAAGRPLAVPQTTGVPRRRGRQSRISAIYPLVLGLEQRIVQSGDRAGQRILLVQDELEGSFSDDFGS